MCSRECGRWEERDGDLGRAHGIEHRGQQTRAVPHRLKRQRGRVAMHGVPRTIAGPLGLLQGSGDVLKGRFQRTVNTVGGLSISRWIAFRYHYRGSSISIVRSSISFLLALAFRVGNVVGDAASSFSTDGGVVAVVA